ncbi:hypothetical protein BGZ68_000099 [Mortierella alpina]|nr:hypothetical protein BGZ68_000099 [Mortierella alpina]
MDSLSTKPRPASVFTAIIRSRRIRGLVFLLTALLGLYVLFLSTTDGLSPTRDRVQLNGDGEPMDLTQDGSSSNFKGGELKQDLIGNGFMNRVVSEPAIVVLEKRIRQLIDSNRVMVFSKTYCPYSAAAKKLLRSYTDDFKVLEVDLEDQDADIKRLLTKITHGHSTFPSIFFQGESIGGRDDLQALEDRNELKSRLESLGVAMLQ